MTTNETDSSAETSDEKKQRMLAGMKPPALPSFSKTYSPASMTPSDPLPTQQAESKPDFSGMRRRSERLDPVAGKKIIEEEQVKTTIYLTTKERRNFKILTAVNGHSMNDVVRRSVIDYIELHKAKLPKG